MARLFPLLLCLSFFVNTGFPQQAKQSKVFLSDSTIGGEVAINATIVEVVQDTSHVTFEISSPEAGPFYINFWMCPARRKDGGMREYDVIVNGIREERKISPTHPDWQSIGLSDGKTVFLNKGINSIAIEGHIPDIPQVEFIRLTTKQSEALISDSRYKAYKAEISNERLFDISSDQEGIAVISNDTSDVVSIDETVDLPVDEQNSPPYNFRYSKGIKYKYTFFKEVYFSKDEEVSISTEGIDGFRHVLEFFSSTNPQDHYGRNDQVMGWQV